MGDFSFDLSGPLNDIPGNVFGMLSLLVNVVFALFFAIYRKPRAKDGDLQEADEAPGCSDTCRALLERMRYFSQSGLELGQDYVAISYLDDEGLLEYRVMVDLEEKGSIKLHPGGYHVPKASLNHLTKRDRKTLLARARKLLDDREKYAQTTFDAVIGV